jgi:ketopantoate reductase
MKILAMGGDGIGPEVVDAINGMAVKLGRELGIPTPYNEVLRAGINP